MHGQADEGDRRQLAQMRATGMANGKADSSRETILQSAARSWVRQGYRVEYDDEHLVQLAAPFHGLSPRDLLLASLVGIGMGALGTLAALGLLRRSRRHRWHIVSLVLTPERRVLTHEQWQPTPSE
jgi:hypothetical protein